MILRKRDDCWYSFGQQHLRSKTEGIVEYRSGRKKKKNIWTQKYQHWSSENLKMATMFLRLFQLLLPDYLQLTEILLQFWIFYTYFFILFFLHHNIQNKAKQKKNNKTNNLSFIVSLSFLSDIVKFSCFFFFMSVLQRLFKDAMICFVLLQRKQFNTSKQLSQLSTLHSDSLNIQTNKQEKQYIA